MKDTADAIVRTLALTTPDVTEDGEQWCAVCDTQLHLGWPSWHEHREDCAYKRAHDYMERVNKTGTCKWCDRQPADGDNVCEPCRTNMAAMSDPLIRSEAAHGRWPLASPKWDDKPALPVTFDNAAQPLARICTACGGAGSHYTDNGRDGWECETCKGTGRVITR